MSKLSSPKILKFIWVSVPIALILNPLLAKSEWDWDDSQYLENKFRLFIESKFSDENLPGNIQPSVSPSACLPLKFGYNAKWEIGTEKSYQVAFQDLKVECWERIKQVIPRVPFKIETENVSGVNFFPFADAGPSIIFKFGKINKRSK